MSRVDVLVSARDNLSVKFMEFTRIASRKRYATFFEGEDEKYYSVRINNIRPDIKWSGINSGGKSKVVELRRKVRNHSTYFNYPCMFFMDSDFDENNEIKEHEDVYITPCYSIENLFVSPDTLCRILSAEFGITDSHEDQNCYEKAMSIFEQTKNAFIEAIRPFNYLIRELRLLEKKGEVGGRLNINNLNFDDLVKLELGSVAKIYDESQPKSIFPELPENISVDFTNSAGYFVNTPEVLWFRGKQNLEFFRIFLTRLKEDRCRKNKRLIFKNKSSVKLHLTKGNCISELSQYADTPPCLKSYLESRRSLSSAA